MDCPGSQSSWSVAVMRTHGLRLMRQEKKWRPIVRIEVDRHHSYETILGCDGQSVNMKETFCFENVDLNSLLDVRIYCQSQTKKKGKRTKEIAAAVGHPLGQLLRKQEVEKKVELRLQCQTQNKKTHASRGKPQNGASVVLRIRPPPSYTSSTVQEDVGEEEEDIPPAYTSGSESSGTLTMPPTPVDPTPPPLPSPPEGMRRRRPKGYVIYSDEEPCSSGGEEGEPFQPLSFSQFAETEPDDPLPPISPMSEHSHFPRVVKSIHTWIAACVLPQYTQQITIPPASMNPAERAISAFTLYSELKEAAAGTESDYEPIFERLQREWQYVGGLLAALAAVNAAVFAISPDSLFQIQPYALSAIAGSSMASGLGTAIDAWFLFRYNWVDLRTFIFRAKDVYGSYFFFALSARMPAVCMLLSALALMAFLGLVAFQVWPEGVAVVFFLVGLIMSLQFLVYGVHWCAGKIVAGGKASRQGVVMVVRKVTQTSVSESLK